MAEMLSTAGGSTAATVLLSLLAVAVTIGGTVGALWWWKVRTPWMSVMRRDTPLCQDQEEPDTIVPVCQFNKPEPIVILTR